MLLERMRDPAASADGVVSCQIWSAGELIDTVEDGITGGSVTERWGQGVRSTLALTVDESDRWLEYLELPTAVVVPFTGVDYGQSRQVWPHGVFPVVPVARSWPSRSLSVGGDDSWQRVVQATFGWPVSSDYFPGLATHVAAWLIHDVGIGWPSAMVPGQWIHNDWPTVTATSGAVAPPGEVWSGSRQDVIFGLCDAAGADCYIDRYGRPTIEDRAVRATGAPWLVDGEDGTVVSVSRDVDYSRVYNEVTVVPAAKGASFSNVTVSITDITHPAHRSRIERRVMPPHSNSAILTEEQAYNAARALLAKNSQRALSWQVECVADPSRSAGDLVTVAVDGMDPVNAVISSVVHPIGPGRQKLTLGALL